MTISYDSNRYNLEYIIKFIDKIKSEHKQRYITYYNTSEIKNRDHSISNIL